MIQRWYQSVQTQEICKQWFGSTGKSEGGISIFSILRSVSIVEITTRRCPWRDSSGAALFERELMPDGETPSTRRRRVTNWRQADRLFRQRQAEIDAATNLTVIETAIVVYRIGLITHKPRFTRSGKCLTACKTRTAMALWLILWAAHDKHQHELCEHYRELKCLMTQIALVVVAKQLICRCVFILPRLSNS